jgi:flagellar biogenesis protein FliO
MASASTFMLFVRLGVAMAVVMGLMFVASGVLKRRGFAGPQRGGVAIDLVARRGLGRSAQVAVVRTGGRELVLGVTDQRITLLCENEIDLDDFDDTDIEVLGDGDEVADGSTPTKTRTSRGQRTAAANGGQFATPGQAWKAMLENVRERTTRR